MEIDLYLHHYKEFHAEFCPGAGSTEKHGKLVEEVFEFIEASMSGSHADRISETLDVMNTAIAYLVSEGVCDPLHAGYQKLQVTAEKYRGENAT